RKQLKRGVHTSVKQLEKDIRSFISNHNKDPKPYRWTKTADEILASVKRCCQKTQKTLCA
ncbi:MAG: IS630 family transposase, partial [Methylocystis sp.]